MPQAKRDLFAENKHEYIQSKKPVLITIDWAWYLAVEGRGKPDQPEFADKLAALYAVAYALKQASKQAGQDYAVCKLEGLWHLDIGFDSFKTAPASAWYWTLLIRTPEHIGPGELEAAKAQLRAAGKAAAVSEVAQIPMEEGRCVQMLHIGPNDQEEPTLAAMHAFVEAQGLMVIGRHHEIYLSDPRKTSPERLKTLLRLPVA